MAAGMTIRFPQSPADRDDDRYHGTVSDFKS
jgi:hypothetical protein